LLLLLLLLLPGSQGYGLTESCGASIAQ